MMQQTILSKVVYSDGQAVDTFTEDVNQKLASGWKLVHLSNTPFAENTGAMLVTAIFEKDTNAQPQVSNPLAGLSPEQVAAVQAAANLSKMQTVGNRDQPNFNFAELFNVQNPGV